MPRPQKTCHSAAFRVTVSRSLAQVVLELLPSCPQVAQEIRLSKLVCLVDWLTWAAG